MKIYIYTFITHFVIQVFFSICVVCILRLIKALKRIDGSYSDRQCKENSRLEIRTKCTNSNALSNHILFSHFIFAAFISSLTHLSSWNSPEAILHVFKVSERIR